MNNREKRIENKKEDQTAFVLFMVLMGLSMFAGLFLVFVIITLTKGQGITGHIRMDALIEAFRKAMLIVGAMAAVVFGWIVPAVLYDKTKKMYQIWDGENLEQERKIDNYSGMLLWIVNVCFIFGWLCMLVGQPMDINEATTLNQFLWNLAGSSFPIFSSIVSVLLFQFLTINLMKEKNPEKRGSAFDVHFLKKWEESSDEAELLSMYKCGYQAYKTIRIICPILALIIQIASYITKIGFMPAFIDLFIWFMCETSYALQGYKERMKHSI